jgi:hypothetical protein
MYIPIYYIMIIYNTTGIYCSNIKIVKLLTTTSYKTRLYTVFLTYDPGQ